MIILIHRLQTRVFLSYGLYKPTLYTLQAICYTCTCYTWLFDYSVTSDFSRQQGRIYYPLGTKGTVPLA